MVFTLNCLHRRLTDDNNNEDRFECTITVNDTMGFVDDARTLIEAELSSITGISSQTPSGKCVAIK